MKDTADKIKPSRAEIRRREHINHEAQECIKQLSGKFLDAFMSIDSPDVNPETTVIKKEISAKWRMFCKRKGLIASAYTVLDQEMDAVINEYTKQKESIETPETTES